MADWQDIWLILSNGSSYSNQRFIFRWWLNRKCFKHLRKTSFGCNFYLQFNKWFESGTFGGILIRKKLYYFIMEILEEKIDDVWQFNSRNWQLHRLTLVLLWVPFGTQAGTCKFSQRCHTVWHSITRLLDTNLNFRLKETRTPTSTDLSLQNKLF